MQSGAFPRRSVFRTLAVASEYTRNNAESFAFPGLHSCCMAVAANVVLTCSGKQGYDIRLSNNNSEMSPAEGVVQLHAKHVMMPKSEVTTVPSQFSLAKTLGIIQGVGHRTIPVVDFGRFVGVVDKMAIYEHVYIHKDVDLEQATVADVMIRDVPTVQEDDLIEKAALKIRGQRIFFLPVVANETENQFVGIIPNSRLLETFMDAFGYGDSGHRVSVVVHDMKGQLAKLTHLITSADCNIISLVTINPHIDLELVRVVVKFTGSVDRLVERLEGAGFRVLDVERDETLKK